jgi:calcineurin-like phosphoesterase family protein
LTFFREAFKGGKYPSPDLIVCTGDVAFGDLTGAPIQAQYEQARAFFDDLRIACSTEAEPLDSSRVFLVPGNHDVDRGAVDTLAQRQLQGYAENSASYEKAIIEHVCKQDRTFKNFLTRLAPYAAFIASQFPHLVDPEGRHHYTKVVDIRGLRVGIAGMNSSWTCAGPGDRKGLWLPAAWVIPELERQLEPQEPDLVLGLLHHPLHWLTEADMSKANRFCRKAFHFLLHGHSHDQWVTEHRECTTIAAGAVGAETSGEFGCNLVELDLDAESGIVHLFTRKALEPGWTIAPISEDAEEGRWPIALPKHRPKASAVPVPADGQPSVPPPPRPELAFTPYQRAVQAELAKVLGALNESRDELQPFRLALHERIMQILGVPATDAGAEALAWALMGNVQADPLLEVFNFAEYRFGKDHPGNLWARTKIQELSVLLGLAALDPAGLDRAAVQLQQGRLELEGALHPVPLTIVIHAQRGHHTLRIQESAACAGEIATANGIEPTLSFAPYDDEPSCVAYLLNLAWDRFLALETNSANLARSKPEGEDPLAWHFVNRLFSYHKGTEDYQFLYLEEAHPALLNQQQAVVTRVKRVLPDLDLFLVKPSTATRWFLRCPGKLLEFFTVHFERLTRGSGNPRPGELAGDGPGIDLPNK